MMDEKRIEHEPVNTLLKDAEFLASIDDQFKDKFVREVFEPLRFWRRLTAEAGFSMAVMMIGKRVVPWTGEQIIAEIVHRQALKKA